jgi:23S rRNA (cytosine1962-C5)-methyltransferase
MDLRIQDIGQWALLASGNGRKLERFGEVLIERPSPQAIWPEAGECRWEEAQAVFKRRSDGSGDWIVRATLPDSWQVNLLNLILEVRLTGFGNVGIFPEHTAHWQWMLDRLRETPNPSVLNLFGYTGGASVVLAKHGVKTTHVDAAKSVNGWAIDNALASGVAKEGIRFLADDVKKFVKREIRRGRKYHGVILDPPTFGRGTKGEVWKIERDFHGLLDSIGDLMAKDASFVVVTAHSPGITPAVLRALLGRFGGDVQSGEMLLSGQGPDLPAGAYARWTP